MNRIVVALIFSVISTISINSFAVDLANRLGVGYSNQMSEDLPAITARYYPNSMVGMSVAIGVDTEKNNSKFGALFKLYRIVFTENNMNFYVGGGAGLLSREVANDNRSGFELNGFLGGEFFFTGLENLGFTFEAGVGIRSDSDGARFRTIGDHPLRGGMIFYF
ncbi:MAG: organic solvent tolerance protein [Bdellovibrionales bacterium]|nr:organic solvent tolerance protein [Bdellovibrionales bacterium]